MTGDSKMKKIICVCLCGAILLCAGCGKTEEKLDKANKQIEQLSYKIDSLVKIMNDAQDIEEEIHEIYDDEAVVKAYKNNDSSNLSDEDKYILEQAEKVIEEKITDSMTDYEKEKAIYDYMYQVTSFDEQSLAAISSTGEYSHTPYGFFKEHSTICVGNATTFKLFMDMLDIDCRIIHSTINGEHAWNIVELDGEWYHVDLTFDNMGSENPTYSFFNVPDQAKSMEDYPWDKSEFPECNGEKYCYGINNSIEVDSVYDIPGQIKNAIDKKQNSVFIKTAVPSGSDAESFIEQLYDVLYYVESDEYLVAVPMMMLVDDNTGVITNIVILYPDDMDNNSGDNTTQQENLIDYDKMQEKFDEAFEGEISLYDEDYYEEEVY